MLFLCQSSWFDEGKVRANDADSCVYCYLAKSSDMFSLLHEPITNYIIINGGD